MKDGFKGKTGSSTNNINANFCLEFLMNFKTY